MGRHPDNHFGEGSPEYWEEERRLYGLTPEQHDAKLREDERRAPKCPICGTAYDCSCMNYTDYDEV